MWFSCNAGPRLPRLPGPPSLARLWPPQSWRVGRLAGRLGYHALTVLFSSPAATFKPPTVAETKAKFLSGYNKPIASIYSTVLQELLVQQHFMRYSKNYQYNPVSSPEIARNRPRSGSGGPILSIYESVCI